MRRFLYVLTIVTLLASSANARIKLATLPVRERVELQLDNGAYTLVEEERIVDPTSVEFRPLEQADQIEVVDTVFLGQKPQHLIWNIRSDYEGQALVEVSYFTSGLTWQMDYVAVSNPQETELEFRGYVRVSNNSGEEYENAEIRMIVGKINLVEKIAELAARNGQPPPTPNDESYRRMKNRATLKSFGQAEKQRDEDDAKKDASHIVKEGVSEYFMFSVDGEETISNGWSKRMEAVAADSVNFDIVYRMRSYQYGPRPVRFFNWKNDKEHELGDSPMPNGIIRVFRDNGKDGLSFLGQQVLQYVPIRADIEVNLGTDDLVVYEQRRTKTERMNFQFNRNSQVTGWDERQDWTLSARNYREKPIVFELRVQMDGDVELTPESKTTSFDYRTVETKFTVPQGDSKDYKFSATTHSGTNAKQNRVQLKPEQ